jgi:hypothetical protein
VANAAKAYARRRALISDEVGLDYRGPLLLVAFGFEHVADERRAWSAAGARVAADLAYARSAG